MQGGGGVCVPFFNWDARYWNLAGSSQKKPQSSNNVFQNVVCS